MRKTVRHFGIGAVKLRKAPFSMGDNGDTTTAPSAEKIAAQEDALLRQFFAEVSEVERDNEVHRFTSLSLSRCLYIETFVMLIDCDCSSSSLHSCLAFSRFLHVHISVCKIVMTYA